jgi:hypothetical protein
MFSHGLKLRPKRGDSNVERAPLVWREDRSPQILERMCTHGIGHPDFDSAAYLDSIGQATLKVHGCDGCCRS